MDITYNKYSVEGILKNKIFYINVISKYKHKGHGSMTESISGLGDESGRRYNKHFKSVSKKNWPVVNLYIDNGIEAIQSKSVKSKFNIWSLPIVG